MNDVIIKINDKTMKELEAFPDNVVYAVARETLDRVGSSKITPYKTGKTEMSMFQTGVRGTDRDYFIGNFTNYASYVYAMPQSVNWTNPLSKAQWFETFWKSSGKSVLENVVARYRL